MTAIHQHRQLNRLGPAEVRQRIQRRAGRPAGIQHIINEDDGAAVDGEGDLGLPHQWRQSHRRAHQVVSIERDVEGADLDFFLRNLQDVEGNALGDGHATAAHANESDIGKAVIVFKDFVGDACQRARDALGIHDDRHIDLFANSQVRV